MGSETCIFCKIVDKKIPAKIVFENSDVLAFEDIKPQAPVHIMIIPKTHIEKISEIKEEDLVLIGKLVLTAKNVARDKKIQERGYRLVMNCNKDAGQEVFHLHLHLLGGRKFGWPPG